jgi:hypothetical protein
MESHELLREVFDKKNAKEVSADLELSTSMIYKWAQPSNHEGGVENPLDRIEALYQSTGDQRLVQWICQRAGGFFILNPKNTPHPHFSSRPPTRSCRNLPTCWPSSPQPPRTTGSRAEEAKEIRARWEELKSVTEGFVACCEEGNFGPLKDGTARTTLSNRS